MKKVFAITAVITAFTLCAIEPGMYEKNKEFKRDGVSLTKFEKTVIFPNGAKINYTILRDSSGKAVAEKWGDFLFGLDFGTPKGSSGGWNRWNIVNVNILRAKKLKDIVSSSLDKIIYKDGILTGELDGASLSIRSSEEFPNFLFVRIVWSPENKDNPYFIRFNSYPGATKFIGARFIFDGENSYEMKKGVNAPQESNMFLVSNKGAFEKSGNIIIWSEKYYNITAKMWDAMVTFDFYPKAGSKTFNYALGFFNGEDPENVIEKLDGGMKEKILGFMVK